MVDPATHHLPLVITCIVLLIIYMFRLDEHILPRRRRPARRRPTFAHREMNGELLLVDPDGRVSRRRKR